MGGTDGTLEHLTRKTPQDTHQTQWFSINTILIL